MPKPKRRHDLNYETITRAIAGDEQAIRLIVNLYKPRIIQKSLRPCYDERTGNCFMYVDPFISGHLESQLMKAIFTFDKHK